MTITHLQNQKDLVDAINAAIAGGGGGGGGPVAWGDITGALADQADLLAALNAKTTSKTTTVTLPRKGVYEHRETITDAAVTGSSKLVVGLAGTQNSDENDPEMLDLYGIGGIANTGSLTVVMSFREKTSGPIKINYSIG